MRNVAPSRALARRARQLLQLAFFVMALGAFAAIIGIAMTAIPLVAPGSRSYGVYTFTSNLLFVGGGFLVVVGIILALRAVTWRTENDLAKITGNALAAYLDDRYTFIRNVSKIGLGYIDAVLVGTQGVLVFRIIDKTGVFLNEADRWLKMNTRDRRWIPARMEPTREAITDMKSLQTFLAKRGLPHDTPIYGVVVFIRDAPLVQITPRDPVLPPTTLSQLYQTLQGNFFARERISKGAADAIVKLLYDT